MAQAEAALVGQHVLHLLQAPAQRLAVGHHRHLGVARTHQALQVAEDGAGLGAGLLVLLEQQLQTLAGGDVLGTGQAQLGVAVGQAFGDLAEAVQVLAKQEHGFRADAVLRQELVRTLADALRQHHQLARLRQFGRRRALLQLHRQHGLGRFQQIAGLGVDGLQRLADLDQRLLLRQHQVGVLLGSVDQRHHRHQQRLGTGRRSRHGGAAVLQLTGVGGQHGGRFLDLDKRGGRATHRLRHRLGQPLRLHQRLAGGAHLHRVAVGRRQRQHRGSQQTDQTDQHGGTQDALLRRHRPVADQRQRGDGGQRQQRAAGGRGGHQAGFGKIAQLA